MKKNGLVAVIILGMLSCTSLPTGTRNNNGGSNFEFCWQALSTFTIFQEKLPRDPAAFPSVHELYASIGDPWTVYYQKDTAKLFMADLSTSSVGMGVYIDSAAGGLLVKQVFPNSPASVAGMLPGDTIVAVGETPLAGLSFKEMTGRIHGTAGDAKQLTIGRAGGRVRISVTLGSYLAPAVFADSLDSAVAYIALSIFIDSTTLPGGAKDEFRQALEKSAWADYTIFDLRSNGGGLVDQSLAIAGEFVPFGTALARSRERYLDTIADTIGTRTDTWSTDRKNGIAYARKFIVLTDRYTASASELLVSCLRDYRPDIRRVGDTTYGKARAQYFWFPTPDSGLAKVTYSLLTPERGAPYDLVGIPPDSTVAAGADALAVARAMIRQAQGRPLAKAAVDTTMVVRINAVRNEWKARGWQPLALRRFPCERQ